MRVENYKVKLTEIVLSPNQAPPDCPDNCENGNSEENESDKKPKYNLRQKIRTDYKAMDEGAGAIDIARTKLSEKILPPKYAWDSFDTDDECDEEPKPLVVTQFESWCSQQPRFLPPSSIFIHWFKDKYPAMNTKQLQSLAENLVKFANLTNPDVSSDSSRVQSESASDPKHSSDEASSTLSSIPLGQGSPKVIHDDYIDTVQTARNSSTDVALLDGAIEQFYIPPEPPMLPSIPERNQSVITCPTGTCDSND